MTMVAERDTSATAAAPFTTQWPPPQIGMTVKRGTLLLSSREHCRSEVIAEREVGTAESMLPPFAELVPLSAVNDRSAGKELISK